MLTNWGVEPARYTKPLSPNFEAKIDRLLPALSYVWQQAFGHDLEPWQIEILRHITELDNGKLRHRQALVSIPRQSGKSELAAALGIWQLLDSPDALIIGVASNADQARIVYQRALKAVTASSLNKRFVRMTETRGLSTKSGGSYQIRAARGTALQGLPIKLGIVDEVHIINGDLWTALVNGTGARNDTLVVGLTTAGDESSDLLKRLYDQGESGQIAYYVYEAPDSDYGDKLAEYLTIANPSIASGRVSLENALADAKSLPPVDLIRYKLNRFTANQSHFIPLDLWAACGSPDPFTLDKPIFAIDRTPDWGFASITANAKSNDMIYTELAASIAKPSLESLTQACLALQRFNPQTFVVDSFALRDLGQELKLRGLPVTFATHSDAINASATLYAKVKRKALRHANDPVLSLQIPRTIRKNIGEGFRISRKDSSIEIDAVMSTTMGVYFAETLRDLPVQIF